MSLAIPSAADVAKRVRSELGALALRDGKLAVRRPTSDAGSDALQLAATHRDELKRLLADPAAIGEWVPGSSQQANWTKEQLSPSSDAHLALVLAVRRRTSGDWSRALEKVVTQHASLRTRYFSDSKGLRAVTSTKSAIEWIHHSPVSQGDLEPQIDVLNEYLDRPFDLEWSVGRVCLLQGSGRSDDLLAVVMHHVATDYRGLEVFAEDLVEAVSLGETWQSRPVEAHYQDFAAECSWNRCQGKYQDRLQALTERLRDFPDHVAVDPAGSEATEGRAVPIVISANLRREDSDRVRQQAKVCGTTPYAVVLEAVSATLLRFAGQDRMVLGCAVSNRDRPEWRRTVGDFVDIVPVPVERMDAPWQQRIEKLQSTLAPAIANRDIALTDVIELLRPKRVGTSAPLCQVVFAWHQRTPGSLISSNDVSEILLSEQRGTQADLLIAVADNKRDFEVRLHAKGTARTRDHLRRLHEAILAQLRGDPWPSVEDSLLRGTVIDEVITRTPAESLSHFAATAPESVAYCGADGTYTYRALADKVILLAGRVAVIHHSPKRVAVLVRRHLGLLAAELAASWIGASFVPIDPSWPSRRVQRVLDSCDPDVLLTDAPDASDFTGRFPVVAVNYREEGVAQAVAAPLPMHMPADASAYIIFTSGSTGEPKGVEVPVGALGNFATQMQQVLGINDRDRIGAFSSAGFDASVFELIVPILIGATTVVAKENLAHDAAAVVDFLEENAVSVFPATPSLMRLMLEDGWRTALRARVISMGEPLDAHLASEVIRLTPEMWDLYGPTEATVWSTAYRVPPGMATDTAIPLGDPLPNTALAVLDGHGWPVPQGVIGELCIFGNGLSTGYFRRPGLTERAFESTFEGRRYYRSGDLASMTKQGTIRLHGRRDLQVKVSGHRVELGDVEACVLAHPGVSNACVISQTLGGRTVLTAFVEAKDGFTVWSLKEQMQDALPSYAVPGRIVTVTPLPLTPSGKVDREKLVHGAEPLAAPNVPTTEHAAPSRRLRTVWREILGHRDFEAESDFFAVGGSSLQAIDLAQRVTREAGVDVRPQHVFAHPVFSDQVTWFESNQVTGIDNNRTQHQLPSTFPKQIAQVTPRAVRAVLVTGATGFLGAHLVDELVQAGVTTVCMVRAGSEHEGRDRLSAAFVRWGLGGEAIEDGRVIPLLGDLGQPGFGMERELPAVDAVVHCAATVNLLLPASTLEQVNVTATVDLAGIAVERGLPFHYISTYSVLDPSQAKHAEEWGVEEHQYLNIPYVQTKWDCESLLDQARQRGAAMSIYRPSRIIGSSFTGASNVDDLFDLVLSCVQEMGIAPDIDIWDNFIPVDEAARAIVPRVTDGSGIGDVHNVASPHWMSWRHFVQLLRDLGSDVSFVDFGEWRAQIEAFTATAGGERYRPLRLFVEQHLDQFLALGQHHPVLEITNADPVGKTLGQAEIDAAYLRRVLGRPLSSVGLR